MDYALRPVETGDADLVLLAGFLARVFDRHDLFTPDYLRWCYVENPAGSVIGTNAWDGDQLVGHYVVLPMRSQTESGVHDSALSLNTAVDPAHHGRRLFTRLAEETFGRAKELGVVEVVGVANANSTPGFLGALGFRDCGSLDAWISWRMPRLGSESTATSWRRVWDEESLRWRTRNPRARYRLDRRGGTEAVVSATGWPGVRAVLRMERDPQALLPLPAAAATPFHLWLGRRLDVVAPPGSFSIPKGLRGARLPIPDRLRPSPLTLCHRCLVPEHTSPDPARMRFEAFDFDAY